jgi:hypothetical protein
MMPAVALAAVFEFEYTNAFVADVISFQITDVTSSANISFADWFIWSPDSNGAAAEWTYVRALPPQSLVFSAQPGSSILPLSGVFSLWLWDGGYNFWGPPDQFDFTLSWTESLNGITLGAGTIDFENGVMVPAPLPASAWMLLSGLAMFVGVRRRNAG